MPYRSGQTTLGKWPCQGETTTHVHRRSSLPPRPHSAGRRVREVPRHVHRRSSLPARPHSAGRRVREEPRHRYTCGQPCGQITLINILQAHLSWCNLHPRNCKSPQLYPERNGQRKRIVRQTKETITGAYLLWAFFARDIFFSTDEEYGSVCFSQVISICSRQSQRGVWSAAVQYGFCDRFRAYKLLPFPLVVEKNLKCHRRRAELDL